MSDFFEFKGFRVRHRDSALKVGTDAVLLGSSMTLLTSDRRALDIGTGCGVIALMAAQRYSDMAAGGGDGEAAGEGDGARIDAVEIDGPSAEEAAFNFAASPWAGMLKVFHSSFSEFRPSLERECKYDLIFSNPPYYDASLLNPDAREAAARHTQTLSYRDICEFASQYLNPGGRLSLVLPAESELTLRRTAASFGLSLFRLVRVRTTPRKPFRRLVAEFLNAGATADTGRFTTANSPEVSPVISPEVSELVLCDPSGDRSKEYSLLTSEFYI